MTCRIGPAPFRRAFVAALSILVGLHLAASGAAAQGNVQIVKQDYQIDAEDPGIKLFLREKMTAGNTRFSNDNIVLFLHGATFPSTPDFDLQYKDYSWADRLVQ